MCEVTRKNFEEKFDQIIDDLRSAAFISFDCEFSGFFNDDSINSLFDSPNVRFNKLQQVLQNVIIIQMGLSAFKYDRESDVFRASSYNFYLLPSTVLPNFKFMCQVGSIEFLCKHEFDFNKLCYEGITFLNKGDEKKILGMIEDGSITYTNFNDEMQQYCSQIAEWSSKVPRGSEMLLQVKEDYVFLYLVHMEIRKRFPSLWTYLGDPGIVKVRKLEEGEKYRLERDADERKLSKILFDSILGFSRIIKEIENLQKPFVGHNCLIDLILIYKQFYNPLPISYKEFKKEINGIFPKVYDTKLMSFRLRDILPREDCWHSNILSGLYSYMTSGRGAIYATKTPPIIQANEGYLEKENFHEAGYDSYCTGFCFLKMAYIFSMWDDKIKQINRSILPTSLSWLLGGVDSMKNNLHLTRGQASYIALTGKDPRSMRPDLIFVRSKTNSPLDVEKILLKTARYGTMDVQILNKFSAVVAAANQKQFLDVLLYLKKEEEMEADKYSFLKHSPLGQIITSATAIASVVIIGAVLSRVWR